MKTEVELNKDKALDENLANGYQTNQTSES